MAKKTKKHSWAYWLGVGVIAQVMIAPAPTVMKVLVDDIDPMLLNALRAALVVVIALPFFLGSLHKLTKKNMGYALLTGIFMAAATLSLVFALKHSPASYVVILSLLQPIILVVLSSKLLKERVSFRSAAGITLAALGAFIAVSLPMLFGGQLDQGFYPLATALILLNCITFPLGLIFYRKAHGAGMPLASIQAVLSTVILVVSLGGVFLTGGSIAPVADLVPHQWLGIAYISIIVIFLARIMSMASMERIGTSAYGGLIYLENILAIIIPVLILGEQLSTGIFLGGILILFGIYLTEQHRSKHHPHSTHHGHRQI